MPHYYFDIETTGLDSVNDKIVTIQYQKIALDTGIPEEPLQILKCWEDTNGEEGIIHKILDKILATNPFRFVPVGNNLNFEYKFLTSKINQYTDIEMDSIYFHSRPSIDLKPVMVLLNGGKFKGYHLVLNKLHNGANVPKWYKQKQYDKITQYIVDEATAFTTFYTKVHHLMFNNELRSNIFNTNRRIDDYV